MSYFEGFGDIAAFVDLAHATTADEGSDERCVEELLARALAKPVELAMDEGLGFVTV